jgi:hypothetical protein
LIPRADWVPQPVSKPASLAFIDRPLRSFVPSFILPCRNRSSEFLRYLLLFQIFRSKHNLPRFSVLVMTSPSRVYLRKGFQSLATFRPQVFSTSRRFSPRLGYAVLFRTAAMFRTILFRGFSFRAADLTHRQVSAPLSFRARPSLSKLNCHDTR